MRRNGFGKKAIALFLIVAMCVQSSGVVGASGKEVKEEQSIESLVDERRAQMDAVLDEAEQMEEQTVAVPVSTAEELEAAMEGVGDEPLTISVLNDIDLDGVEIDYSYDYNYGYERANIIIHGNGFQLSKSEGLHFSLSNTNLMLYDITINGCETGGGIESREGDLIVKDSVVEACANVVDAALVVEGYKQMINGIDTRPHFIISNSQIINNKVGGIGASEAIIHIADSSISSNAQSGVYADFFLILNIFDSEIFENNVGYSGSYSNWGGGIYLMNEESYEAVPSVISGTEIYGNENTLVGGGIYTSCANLKVVNSEIHNNSSEDGGGMACEHDDGNIRLYNTNIYENSASGNGGGAYISESNFVMSGCSIGENSAEEQGGGLYLRSCISTLQDSDIMENTSGGEGSGVLFHNSPTELENCDVSSNSFGFDGSVSGNLTFN